MLDQKRRFNSAGIRAEFVGSTQQDESAIDDILHGQVQPVYISPESLLNNTMLRAMFQTETYKANLIALVVDEAHCVELWKVLTRVHNIVGPPYNNMNSCSNIIILSSIYTAITGEMFSNSFFRDRKPTEYNT